MEQFDFKFGTPKPVSFRETMGTNRYDIDLQARCAGSITVTEYDTEKYGDREAMILKFKKEMPEILAQSLEELAPRSVMMRIARNKGPLNEAIEAKLADAGVKAKVEIVIFTLTEESQKLFDETEKLFREEFLRDIAVDRTDRPCTDWIQKYKPDCVLEGVRDASPVKGFSGLFPTGKKDVFCSNCGAKRIDGAKFCTECGTKFNLPDQ